MSGKSIGTKRIMVCDKCLRAACYHGEFMCDDAQGAGTVIKTVGELRPLKLEHPDHWSAKTMTRVYGSADPFPGRAALASPKPGEPDPRHPQSPSNEER